MKTAEEFKQAFANQKPKNIALELLAIEEALQEALEEGENFIFHIIKNEEVRQKLIKLGYRLSAINFLKTRISY